MDEAHLAAAVRYVALNPVRARLVRAARDWRWSSVHAHLTGQDDGVTAVRPILDRFPDFAGFIEAEAAPEPIQRLRQAETIGRPLGDEAFIRALETATGRTLMPGKRGPKPKAKSDAEQSEFSGLSL